MTRDYLQAKAADAVFAISDILNPGEFGKPSSKGVKYENKAGKQVVDGGTGYAVEMGIKLSKPVYVFHQGTDPNHKTPVGWYKWDGKQFVAIDTPTLTKKYAGVGTRHINAAGVQAIKNVYQQTFSKPVSKPISVALSPVRPTTNILESRVQIQSGFFDYGKLSAEDERIILNEAIKQTNKQGYPVKKAVVYAHWGNMWAVTDKGADAFPVFGKHLKRSEESAGLGKGLNKIDLPKSNIEHNDDGKGWYDYYPTDQNGNKLDDIPQVIRDILQKKLGLDMSVYDSAIINSYGETTELSRHIDNTEDKGYAYKIPIVSISLIGDSVFQYSEPSDNPNHSLPDNKQVSLVPGQVVVFGGASRAMAHRVLNGKSGNAIGIKNSVDSLKTERINITLRRALPLTKEEYDKWISNNKILRESSPTETKMPKKPFERTFVPPTRDAQGNVISKDKQQPMAPPEVVAEQELKEKINKWIEEELPWTVSTPAFQLAEMYRKEKLSSETIEEFLKRLSCAGKLI
jgi:alkylated DNA repair dioxygenase AlkB